MTKKLIMAAASVAAFLVASPALAQSAAVSIDVTLSVGDGCIVSFGGGSPLGGQALLDFGQTSTPSTTTIDSTTSAAQGGIPITITCNSGLLYSGVSVAIGGSNNGIAGVRRMQNIAAAIAGATEAQQFLPYRLYGTAARSPVAEYTPGNGLPLQGSPLPNVPFEIVVFGRILGTDLTQIVPGAYTDQTVMIVTF